MKPNKFQLSFQICRTLGNTKSRESPKHYVLMHFNRQVNQTPTSKDRLSRWRRRRERCGARIGLYSAFKIGGSFASFASNEPLFTRLRLGSRCWLYAQLARVDSRFCFWRVGVSLFLSGIPGSVVLSPRVRVSRSVFYFLTRSSTPAQKQNTDGVTRTQNVEGKEMCGYAYYIDSWFSSEFFPSLPKAEIP